jgi:hypothetical protein
MTIFTGDSKELEERLAYELGILEYLRRALFHEVESSDSTTITLGDVTAEGKQRQTHNVSIHESFCSGAVADALSHFRPLAFSAVFKMHDMIAEWILKENPGWDSNSWKFQEKARLYDRLVAQGSLVQPSEFVTRPSVSGAFWRLYRFLTPYRNTVVHAGGISLGSDGSLYIKPARKPSLTFSSDQLSSYIRALCILAKSLLGQIQLDSYLDVLVQNSLAKLSAFHDITTLQHKNVRLTELVILVPRDLLRSADPLSVEIDWAKIRKMMHESLIPNGDGEVFFSAKIEIQQGRDSAQWLLPLEAVPLDKTIITVGDDRFDPYFLPTATSTR